MTTSLFDLPVGFHTRALATRARMYANGLRELRRPELALAVLLEELAVEVELGQRTDLTYRGHDTPPAPPTFIPLARG